MAVDFLKNVFVILILLILFAGCGSVGEIVEIGDTVSVNYVGTLDDGKVFDTSIREVAENPVVTKTDAFSEKSVYTPLSLKLAPVRSSLVLMRL
jgi:peptidylprolyl isomerase